MKILFSRGSVVLNIITVLLFAGLAVAVGLPRYEQAKFKRNFSAAIQAGEALYNVAQTYYIERGAWPAAVADLRTELPAPRTSDWSVGTKQFSCELAYGRGERATNDIQCAPMGKFSSAIFYQIVLAENRLNQRYCWAVKTNKPANEMCRSIGGFFSHNVAGRATPFSVYTIQQ